MTNHNQVSNTDSFTGNDYPNITKIQSDSAYWENQGADQLVWGYFCLELIRQFEQKLLERDIERIVHGPIHSSVGQEAVAVGTAMALSSEDKITSTHRAHHHFLAKAVAHYGPPSKDILSLADSEILKECVRRTMAEIMGLNAGWVAGRGGSMHLFDDASGNIGTQAIVAGNVPYASGIAFAEKFRGTGNVALAFFGDGAVSIGPYHEGICISKVYQLPTIFFIENNLYGVSTNVREATSLGDLAIRAAGYNIPGLIVDGMNPLAVKRAVELAKAHAVAGNGPVMIEAKTYRYFHQSGGMPGSAFGYRTKKEEEAWAARDPLNTAPRALVRHGLLGQHDVDAIHKMASDLVADAVEFCTEMDENEKRQARPDLVPDPSIASTCLWSDGYEFEGISFRDHSHFTETRNVKVVTAKSKVIARWMETDPETFVAGEDVANLKGGPYGATRDAVKQFPDRVLNAPIAEGGFVGLGHGAAVSGMRPIIEIMFCDFALIAADELFNQVATCRYMYNGRVDVPLVVRSRCSAGRGYGAQHSGDTVGLFALFPGWRIVAPTTPFDYIGLFNSAMRSLDPVLVMEHHEVDLIEGPVPVDDLDYCIPLGSAAIPRSGTDLTIVAYLSMVPRVLRIAEELASEEGIDIEVIDLRSLDHDSLDFDTVLSSVKKTGQVLIVEQAMETQSLGPFIATQIHERAQDQLKQPVRRLHSLSVPIPVSLVQERTVLISDEKIREGILQTVKRTASIST
ncbi:MAG: MFS transporter [Planctomycetaceae bacterium]|nr:MFS transporter [Planctomycetaceae bacterium]